MAWPKSIDDEGRSDGGDESGTDVDIHVQVEMFGGAACLRR